MIRIEAVGKSKVFETRFKPAALESKEFVICGADSQAVYISTPPSTHAAFVMKALKSGKHVLCEKPAFLDEASARAAVRLADERELVLIESWPYTFHDQWRWLKEKIQNKFFYCDVAFGVPIIPVGWREVPRELGAIGDFAVYAISVALEMGDLPVETVVVEGQSRNGVPFYLAGTITTAKQSIVSFRVGYGLQFVSRLLVWGTDFEIELEKAFNPRAEEVVRVRESVNYLTTYRSFQNDHWCRMLSKFRRMVVERQTKDNYKVIEQAKVLEKLKKK